MITWSELAGSHQIACLSSCTSGSALSCERPPSSEIVSRTPPSSTRSGLFGSIRIWLKYIGRGLLAFTLRHDAPPSSDRKMPLSPPPGAFDTGAAPRAVAAPSASIDAYKMLALRRNTSSPMRPSDPAGSPPPDSFVHVSPASVDFHTLLPGPPPFIQHASRRRW